MRKIDRILISSDDSPLYIQFLPIVSLAWQKILGIKPTIAYVTDKDEKSYAWMREYCQDIIPFEIDENLPNGRCKTFAARLIMRYKFGDDICMVSDIDMLPLSYKFNTLLDNYIQDGLIIYGYNAYKFGDGDPDTSVRDPNLRKFPSCYTIASSKVWGEIINPEKLSDSELVKSWYNIRHYDHKESVNKPNFDDESLVRAMIQKWNPQREKIIGIDRAVSRYGEHGAACCIDDRLDRSRWRIDENRLMNGTYIDAHCPRPMQNYLVSMERLAKYLEIPFITIEENICQK